MANHQSANKRMRQYASRRLRNRYQARTTRNAVKKLKSVTDKTEAKEQYPKVVSMLDKLANKNIIHKNKAANLKSQVDKHMASL